MRRILLIACTALLALPALPAVATAQDDDAIATALLAAPTRARDDAGVVSWDDDGARVVLRESSNGMVCWDQSSWPSQRPFSVRCTAEANLARVEQNRAFLIQAGSAEDARALFDAAEADGSREVSQFGTNYYSLQGNDPDNAFPHVTISTPNATGESLGLPNRPSAASAWVMNEGTSGAHIMIPGR